VTVDRKEAFEMHKYSQKAASFVVMAYYDHENPTVRSFTVRSETPVGEIFQSLWPTGSSEVLAGTHFARIPFRVEILPDESSIPAVEDLGPPGLFDTVAA
jgi:hypothetical protein